MKDEKCYSTIGWRLSHANFLTGLISCMDLDILAIRSYVQAAGMTIMAVSVGEICENTKLAREMALTGNYESALVYYQGTVQMIHRLLITIADPTRKSKWQLVRILSFLNTQFQRKTTCSP